MGNIKWGRIVVWSILGAVIIVAALYLYVTIRMVILGAQGEEYGPEAQKAVLSGPAVVVVLGLAALVAGFFGGRSPARKAEGSYLLNGLLAGAGMTILYLVYMFVSGSSLGLWMLVIAALAIGGGALGGWVGGRAAEAEAYD